MTIRNRRRFIVKASLIVIVLVLAGMGIWAAVMPSTEHRYRRLYKAAIDGDTGRFTALLKAKPAVVSVTDDRQGRTLLHWVAEDLRGLTRRVNNSSPAADI